METRGKRARLAKARQGYDGKEASSSCLDVLLNKDLLAEILTTVSSRGGFRFAAVCRTWLEVSTTSLSTFSLTHPFRCSPTEQYERELVRQLSKFRSESLRYFRLSCSYLPWPISDEFCKRFNGGAPWLRMKVPRSVTCKVEELWLSVFSSELSRKGWDFLLKAFPSLIKLTVVDVMGLGKKIFMALRDRQMQLEMRPGAWSGCGMRRLEVEVVNIDKIPAGALDASLEVLLLREYFSQSDPSNLPFRVPRDFSRLTNLKKLALRGVKTDGLVPALSSFHQLTVFELQLCPVRNLNSALHQLRRLRWLRIGECNMLETLPDFSHLPDLRTLMLDRCERVCHIPSSFLLLTRIKRLVLTRLPGLTHLPPGSWDRLRNLKSVDLNELHGLLAYPLWSREQVVSFNVKVDGEPILSRLDSFMLN